MKLIVHGQQAFGKAVLEAVLDKSVDEVVAVYSAPDKEGRPLDPLKECALEKGLSVYQPVSYKDPAVWEQLGTGRFSITLRCCRCIKDPVQSIGQLLMERRKLG